MACLAALSTAVLLASCGGGSSTSGTQDPDAGLQISAGMIPASSTDGYRFLTQATFGPTSSDLARVNKIGYDNWINEQFNKRPRTTHLQTVLAAAKAKGQDSPSNAMLIQSWWTHAVQDPAQLRQRVAFALSEIFVVSTNQVDARSAAHFLDVLTDKADANYRDLLEAVALHPAMGVYLSHMSNQKEDLTSGRVPDENFAREVMQLFSIGLYELNDSAKPIVVNGKYVETYTGDDIKGLAKVFTGWGWYIPESKVTAPWWRCFWRSGECADDSQYWTNMVAYNLQHSTSVKQFLGVSVAAQSQANAKVSLKAALDRLASHNNTAPFISRQLIQRLVSSNPSDDYVADITQVFRSNSGNLREVVKAILLHPEARHPTSTAGVDMSNYGKLREPLLRLTHLMRAVPHTSDGFNANGLVYLVDDTDNTGYGLGQTPMKSPSVFNFFRPGYAPPQTSIASAGLVAPEMQITNETTVLGYANYMAGILDRGWGQWNSTLNRSDVQFDLTQWDALASQPAALVKTISMHLLGTELPASVAELATTAITTMPVNNARARRQRVQAAILMVAVSPSFLVQQ